MHRAASVYDVFKSSLMENQHGIRSQDTGLLALALDTNIVTLKKGHYALVLTRTEWRIRSVFSHGRRSVVRAMGDHMSYTNERCCYLSLVIYLFESQSSRVG